MSHRLQPARLLPLLGVPLALAGLTGPIAAHRAPTIQPFAEAELFLELNDTDGDLGIHASIDGGTWTRLEVDGPGERDLLEIVSRSRLRAQGLTQLAFESAEPTFDELDPALFFKRFPEGVYDIEAVAQDGGLFASKVRLSHVLAAPAQSRVNHVPAAEHCDATLPVVSAPVVVEWDPVTTSHPDIGRMGPVTISRYQFFVQQDSTKVSVDLPPTATSFAIPTAITATGGQFKFEIIARTSTGNNTAVESCFVMQ